MILYPSSCFSSLCIVSVYSFLSGNKTIFISKQRNNSAVFSIFISFTFLLTFVNYDFLANFSRLIEVQSLPLLRTLFKICKLLYISFGIVISSFAMFFAVVITKTLSYHTLMIVEYPS